jgi:hypothetical protein
MLVLLSAMALGVWADSSFGGGDGSAKNPYIINATAHWEQFATDVNGGNAYSDKYFVLEADITVSTMVGAGTKSKDAKPFSGTFDGGGHTLTFNHTATEAEGDVAPFRFVRSATISNLHVAGEINTAYRHAGGLAGRTYGTTLIKNCRVSTVINSSHEGDATHGGIVALKPDYSSAKLTIEGCVFDGKLLTTNGSTLCGGFVGYTSYGSLTIKNSIYAPAEAAEGETAVGSQKTFYRYSDSHPGTITLDKCYYTQPLGSDVSQGKQALSIGFPEDIDIDIVPTGETTEYSVSGITVYEGSASMKYNGTLYAGSSDVVTITFTNNYEGCEVKSYNVAEGDATLTKNITGDYTLEMNGKDVVLGFSMTDIPLLQIPGEGTEANPYIISDAIVWDYIVSLLNYRSPNGVAVYPQYASAYYQLTDDITVTKMMGSESNRFSGHFDGGIYDEDHNLTGYHTLTVDYDTDEQYTASFRYVNGAEISNLRVAGTIKTSKKFAAGFVANAQGSNSIFNCRSSVTISSSVSGDGSHGGFVAHNLSGSFTMKGCAFDGSMLGSSTNKCGGFVGWNETNGSPSGVVKFEDCFFAPTSHTMDLEHTYARSRINDGAHVIMYYSNCRTNINDNQQFRVYSISAGDGVTITASQTVSTTYNVSGITIYDVGMMYDGVLYARNEQTMSLNLGYTGAGTLAGFASSAGTLGGDGNPFTLTMGTADAVINAISGGSGWSGNGSGTSESPYIISTTALWNEFANKVNSGVFGFNTAYYKLTDDITVTTMVGTESHKFKGHFDGGGHMLTLSYGTAESPFSENYCAPFRYIENAGFSNLTVAGTIYTENMFAAGLVGFALNNNTITNCRSSVTINSSINGDGTHGGFVANCQNNMDTSSEITFTNCAFNGSLLGANSSNWGGFVGWTEGNDWANVKTKGCLFAPAGVNVDSDGSATFSRGRDKNWDHITIEDSYYTQSLGTIQGNMAYTTPPANVTSEPKTIAGITVYARNTVVTDVTVSDITPYQATISWKGTDACSNYQVRYREKKNSDIYSTSFEDGMPDGWTTFDNDDDNEHSWTHDDGTKKGMAHSGKGCMYSASYINNYGSLEPDNWLVTPQLDLSGTMKVWLKGQDGDDYREHFAIYLITSATGSKSDFINADGSLKSGVVTLVPETETTNEYQEYTADLSAYSGQKGYIAIRHFNCYDQFYLVLDDFLIYDENLSGAWTTVPGASASGGGVATITGLTSATAYEYQVAYDYSSNTYYTPTMILNTLADDVAPTDLTATAITATTATIGWKGFGDRYNLRYRKGGVAKVTLYVPNDVWGDGSGYQLLLDKDHNTYGFNSVIPTSGGMTGDADELAAKYALFEYKLPENADCALNTSNMLNGTDGKQNVTITIPAGIYDWCITNPTPDDRMWIAANNGNVGGRQNDFTFEAGKHYTFTVTLDDISDNDCVNMTVEDDELATSEVTEVTGITNTSYSLSGLDASTYYTVYVQSVKGDKTSEWSSVSFTTLNAGELFLYDRQDNSGIIADNNNEQRDVTLQGRTLYKDGSWNTLCLPFQVAIEGSPLEGATVMELDATGTYDTDKHTGFDATDGTLYLFFKTVTTSIEAGKPYIVKWTKASDYDDDHSKYDITDPVFSGVTIDNTASTDVTASNTGYQDVEFRGTYSPVSLEANDNSCLFLSAANTLYYPKAAMNVNACRAYFHVDLNGTAGIRRFVLEFDNSNTETTGILPTTNYAEHTDSEVWYSLDGRRLSVRSTSGRLQGKKPTAKGVYVYNGKKIVVK